MLEQKLAKKAQRSVEIEQKITMLDAEAEQRLEQFHLKIESNHGQVKEVKELLE